MATKEEAIAALDAHPEHEAAWPMLRALANGNIPPRWQMVVDHVTAGPPPAPPSPLRMAVGFAAAAAAHVAGGLRTVDDATFAARRASCVSCPTHYDAARHACLHCGCGTVLGGLTGGLDAKLRWSVAACPLGRWPADEAPPLDGAARPPDS